jgi:hypothetical protein
MLISYLAVAPDVYRISADGVEVGSISKRLRHVQQVEQMALGRR